VKKPDLEDGGSGGGGAALFDSPRGGTSPCRGPGLGIETKGASVEQGRFVLGLECSLNTA